MISQRVGRRRTHLLLVLAALMLCGACSGGLSHKFRGSAADALEVLRKAGDEQASVEQADAAVAEAKARIKTNADLHATEVLDWYATLLHRRDRKRTANWRAICDSEAELYLAGKQTGQARVWGDLGPTDIPLKRGDCQAAVFQMMAEDCRQHVAHASDCEF